MKTKRIIILTLIIVIFGLISVYSSSHVWALYKYDDSLYYIKRQAIFACIGIIAMFITSRMTLPLPQHLLRVLVNSAKQDLMWFIPLMAGMSWQEHTTSATLS